MVGGDRDPHGACPFAGAAARSQRGSPPRAGQAVRSWVLSGNRSSAVTRLVQDVLADRVPDKLVDHGPVGRDAVGQRVRAGQLHDPRVHPVGGAGIGDAARAQPRDVPVLGRRVRGEQVLRQPRVRGQQRILHHHQVVDGVEAVLAQGVVAGLLRVRQQRHHVRPLARDADPGGQFPGGHHVRHVPAGRDGHDVGRRLVLRDVLVAGQHPGHPVAGRRRTDRPGCRGPRRRW